MRKVHGRQITPLPGRPDRRSCLILVLAYLGFTKDIPFTRPFELKAVFQNAPPIQTNSAGPDRRRRRRQGLEGRAAGRRLAGA